MLLLAAASRRLVDAVLIILIDCHKKGIDLAADP